MEFYKINIFPDGEINKRSFSNPLPSFQLYLSHSHGDVWHTYPLLNVNINSTNNISLN